MEITTLLATIPASVMVAFKYSLAPLLVFRRMASLSMNRGNTALPKVGFRASHFVRRMTRLGAKFRLLFPRWNNVISLSTVNTYFFNPRFPVGMIFPCSPRSQNAFAFSRTEMGSVSTIRMNKERMTAYFASLFNFRLAILVGDYHRFSLIGAAPNSKRECLGRTVSRGSMGNEKAPFRFAT